MLLVTTLVVVCESAVIFVKFQLAGVDCASGENLQDDVVIGKCYVEDCGVVVVCFIFGYVNSVCCGAEC